MTRGFFVAGSTPSSLTSSIKAAMNLSEKSLVSIPALAAPLMILSSTSVKLEI